MTAFMFLNTQSPALQLRLNQLLEQEEQSFKEFDLLKTLEKEGFFPRLNLSNSLLLFRAHFFLFHNLYWLSFHRQQQGQAGLLIHALEICIEKTAKKKNLVDEPAYGLSRLDHLQHYYLDWRPLFITDTQKVEALLECAHRGLASPEKLDQALKLFRLTAPLQKKQVTKSYRQLILKHHPDKGGTLQAVQELNEAREILNKLAQT